MVKGFKSRLLVSPKISFLFIIDRKELYEHTQSEFVLFLLYESFGVQITIKDYYLNRQFLRRGKLKSVMNKVILSNRTKGT